MIFYLLALLMVIIGGVLWYFGDELAGDKSCLIKPWIASAILAFVTAGAFQMIAFYGMTDDIETWSGETRRVDHYPRWVEEYKETHTRTVGSGKNAYTETYTTTEYETHGEWWGATRDFGSTEKETEISEAFYNDVKEHWGNNVRRAGYRSASHFGGHCVSGDARIYETVNETGYQYPSTIVQHFRNRLKATPTVFSFAKVPTNVPVYLWPENPDTFSSGRVLGTAKQVIDTREWDIMNANLGPSRKVNLIIVGFNSDDEMLGRWQQAKWVGGKKNDLVITYGGPHDKPTWCFVFGWTESELCKKKIEGFIMDGFTQANLLPYLEGEVRAEYKIKDWKKFDYIAVHPAGRYYVWYFVITLLTQGGLWVGLIIDARNHTLTTFAMYDNVFSIDAQRRLKLGRYAE